MQVLPNFLCTDTLNRIHAILRYPLALLLVTLLQACGGGIGSTANNSGANGSSAIVTGVAATGLAINGSVTLKDATGATSSASISQPSGTFSLDVTGLTPPYFLKATDTTGTTTLYSIASGTGNFNINPLTNLTVVAAAMAIDPLAKNPDAVFSNPANFANLSAADLQAATSAVMAQMSPAFHASMTTNGASNVNPLTDSFQVGNGLDKVFDNYAITLNTATGEMQERQVVNNTTTVLGLVDKLGTFPAAGIYDGTVNTTQSGGSLHQVHDMIVTSSGEVRYVMDNGVQVIARLTSSGSTVTGTGKAYALTSLNGVPTNFVFADGSTAINLTINGTLGASTLSGTYTFGTYTDTFSFALNNTQTTTSSSLGKIAGTYASSTESSDIFIGHIEANGSIWGSSQGIAYSGLIQVIDPNTNLYRVTLAYLKQGIYGYVSGLATFYDISPTADALPKPTALVPDGYTGEVASLSYSPAIAGTHGKLLMQLSSPLQQIFVSAVRMSTLQQTISLQPTAGSLMIQAVGNPAFSVTTTGDIQYSGSAATAMFAGTITSSAGIINVITNPGVITLNGPNQIAVPLPSAVASSLSSISTSLQPLPSSAINWQSFDISPASTVNFAQQSSSQAVLNSVTASGNTITGSLTSNGGGSVMLTGTLATAGTGSTTGATIAPVAGISGTTGSGSLTFAGGTIGGLVGSSTLPGTNTGNFALSGSTPTATLTGNTNATTGSLTNYYSTGGVSSTNVGAIPLAGGTSPTTATITATGSIGVTTGPATFSTTAGTTTVGTGTVGLIP